MDSAWSCSVKLFTVATNIDYDAVTLITSVKSFTATGSAGVFLIELASVPIN